MQKLEVVEIARTFAATFVRQHAAQWERDRQMPRDMFLHAAEMGLCGLLVPQEQGGSGIDFRTLVDVVEVLAYEDFATAFALVVHNNHVRAIGSAGTPEQVRRWLPDMIAGKTIGAFLLTEPAGGSDAGNIATVAAHADDGYVLNGDKAWVTNARHADLLNVFAQTELGSGPGGIVSLQVPVSSHGVERIESYDMLGGYAMNAGGFRFHDVRVEADQVLVAAGKGFKAAMSGIDIARTVVGGMCCGVLRSCIDVVMPRMLAREAFGRPLIEQQGLAWQIADVATDLAASELLTAEAARLIDAGEAAAVAAAHAKKFSTSVALKGVAACMQAMGADGLKHDYPFARHLAAAKIAEYIDGTTQIQNVVITRALRKRY